MPDRALRCVGCLARLACRVCCWSRFTADKGAGYGGAGGIQAQCVGRERAAFSESVVSKISGQRSLRLSDPTNDVTAHIGRIGSWSEYGRPHSHTLDVQLTRKLFRRTVTSTEYNSCWDPLAANTNLSITWPRQAAAEAASGTEDSFMTGFVIDICKHHPTNTMRRPNLLYATCNTP